MEKINNTTTNNNTSLNEKEFNKTFDLGSLTVFDTNNLSLSLLTEEDIANNTKSNLQLLFSNLYKIKTTQIGDEEEERDYDKPANAIKLPEPTIILPRSMPIPKGDKTLTKWEKFSKDKGIMKIKRRSRMIWSDELQKYLPRWGKNSIKHEERKANYIIEDKPKYEGVNPFTFEKQQQKLVSLKQKKRELNNEKSILNGSKSLTKNNNYSKDNNNNDKNYDKLKEKKENLLNKKRDRDSKLKDEKKSQRKNMEIVQKSTASQGRFDRKLKNEPKINNLKKQKLDKVHTMDSKKERERDSKIMNKILGKK